MKLRDLYVVNQTFMARSLPGADDERPKSHLVERSQPKIVEPIRSVENSDLAEVERIVMVWSNLLNVTLKPEHVQRHLGTLKRWQQRIEASQGASAGLKIERK